MNWIIGLSVFALSYILALLLIKCDSVLYDDWLYDQLTDFSCDEMLDFV